MQISRLQIQRSRHPRDLTGANRGNRDFSFPSQFPLFAPVKFLLPVFTSLPWQDQPADSICDLHFVEVDQQTDQHVEQLHVA